MKDQRSDGLGCYYYQSSNYCEGTFKEGAFDGVAVHYFPNEEVSVPTYYTKSQRNGPVVQVSPDGVFYKSDEEHPYKRQINNDGKDGKVSAIVVKNGEAKLDTESETWIDGDKMYKMQF